MRYTVYNPIVNFYKRNKGVGYPGLSKAKGYQYDKETGTNIWLSKYIKRLTNLGYTHCKSATQVTGGDNDYLVVDHKEKQFCFWENGFAPFCGRPGSFPETHNLEYWADHRK